MRGVLGAFFILSARIKPRLDKVRYLWMSRAFEQAGKRGSIGRKVRFHGNLQVELGDRVAFRDGCQFGGCGVLEVGDRTTVNSECIIASLERISIGSDVMLAPRVYVLDVDHKFEDLNLPISQQGYEISPVTIGNGVWIGTGVVVTRGVNIGEGAIIGANSVVTHDIPPFSIAVGIPARVIKVRQQ